MCREGMVLVEEEAAGNKDSEEDRDSDSDQNKHK
jgi:hypothetical protein